jgi:hypothetical protein
MNGLVAAPLQFCADRRFAGAGNAFNQIVFDAHFSLSQRAATCGTPSCSGETVVLGA